MIRCVPNVIKYYLIPIPIIGTVLHASYGTPTNGTMIDPVVYRIVYTLAAWLNYVPGDYKKLLTAKRATFTWQCVNGNPWAEITVNNPHIKELTR